MRFHRRFFWSAAAGIVAICAAAGQAQKTDGDWPMYARDLAGTKFPPLKQITADNAGRLQPAWSLTLVEPQTPSNPLKEVWIAELPGQGNANPITYTGKNGKQYVAIVATDSLQVFAIP